MNDIIDVTGPYLARNDEVIDAPQWWKQNMASLEKTYDRFENAYVSIELYPLHLELAQFVGFVLCIQVSF